MISEEYVSIVIREMRMRMLIVVDRPKRWRSRAQKNDEHQEIWRMEIIIGVKLKNRIEKKKTGIRVRGICKYGALLGS